MHEHAPCPHVHLPLVDAPVLKAQRAEVEAPTETHCGTSGSCGARALVKCGPRRRTTAPPVPRWAESRTERLRSTRLMV